MWLYFVLLLLNEWRPSNLWKSKDYEKHLIQEKNEWPEYKLFSSMLFQNTPPPKCPPSTPLSPVPLLTRWNLQQKFSFFLAILGLEKKVEVRVPSYKKQNFNYENCFRKFSLHVSLHVCTNFKKEKKNSAPSNNICTCKKKKISFEKKNRVVKTGSDSKTISIPIMSKKNLLCLS